MAVILYNTIQTSGKVQLEWYHNCVAPRHRKEISSPRNHLTTIISLVCRRQPGEFVIEPQHHRCPQVSCRATRQQKKSDQLSSVNNSETNCQIPVWPFFHPEASNRISVLFWAGALMYLFRAHAPKDDKNKKVFSSLIRKKMLLCSDPLHSSSTFLLT